jgi:hypothetical protein
VSVQLGVMHPPNFADQASTVSPLRPTEIPEEPYFCAVAESSAGTTHGAVLSFLTPGLPSVVSGAVSSMVGTSAVLNGQVSGNGGAGTAWFRYATTRPAACDDAFGVREPTSAGSLFAANASALGFSQGVSGLVEGTTYHWCAIASNGAGTAFGSLQSFTTPKVPSVTTSSASDLSGPTPRLSGAASPNGADTTAWFRYGTVNPDVCNDTFGARTPSSLNLGSGSADVPYSQSLSDLQPGATYYFCAIAQNLVGTAFGQVLTFNANAPIPTVTTLAATDVEGSTATLNGSVSPNGTVATGWFRYVETRPDTCDDVFGTRVPGSGGMDLGSVTTPQSWSVGLTSLKAKKTYFYCAVASNMGGAGFGAIESFTTRAAPPIVGKVTSSIAEDGTVTFATTVNANGSATTASFRYDLNSLAFCGSLVGRGLPSEGFTLPEGYDEVRLSAEARNLAPGNYGVCVSATNAAGSTVSEIVSLTVTKNAGGCGCSSLDGAAVLVALIALTLRRRGAAKLRP